jgi:hypothetical protein
VELSQEEYEAMTAVLTAAIAYAERIEYATRLLEEGSGYLSASQEDEIVERDSECAHALVEAVRKYRELNTRRMGA